MKLLSAALTVFLAQGLAVALPADSNDPRSGGLRSSSIHRGTRETSAGAVDPDYWIAPIKNVELTCIDNSIRAGGGKPLHTCIREGEALCIEYEKKPPMGGKWAFGVKDSMVKLWNPRMEVVWEFCTEVTHVCIGEVHGYVPNRYSKERPYLYFYNEKTHQTVGNLTCDGTDGKEGKNLGESTILKLVDDSHLGQYVQYPIDIVKFKKGMTPDPTDDNSLWNITYNPADPQRLWWDSTQDFDATYSYNEDKCEWTDLCPSNAPSNVPSVSPYPSVSPIPTISSQPSTLASPYELAPAGDCSPFEDISSTGIEVDLFDDDSSEIFFGGNTFTFYTTPARDNKVFLSSNGYLSFLPNTDDTDFSPDPIPNPNDPDNFVAPFWTDLNPGQGGSIYYLITPTEFIAQWSDVPHFFATGQNTFQVSLSFDTGAIEFRYYGVTDDGGTVTIGVENENGRRGLPIPTQDILAGTTTCVRIVNLAVMS